MDRNIKKYLEDIILSIEEIEAFLEQRPRQFQIFLEDTMFRRAIERDISIIGEAVTKILQLDSNIEISNAQKIKGTRNYIVHSYDTLNEATIWGIVINHLPKLKLEVQTLLDP